MSDVERPGRTMQVSGRAGLVGFTSATEVREALFAIVRERVGEAIATREEQGLISSRGDAAATLFLDAPRIEQLLAIDGKAVERPPSRRERSFLRRLEHNGPDAPPLALGLERWHLDRDAVLLLGAALAVATEPALARLIAFLGGDSSRPGLTVEAAAALLGSGHDAVIKLERMMAPGAALNQNGLLSVVSSELPFLRRGINLHPRLIAIAAGAAAPENMPVTLHQARLRTSGAIDGDDLLALRAIASRRTGKPVIGWLTGEEGSDLLEVLAAAIATDDRQVLVTPLVALGESAAAVALIREARLARAVIAVTEISQRMAKNDARRAAQNIDVLAAAVPVVMLAADTLNPSVNPTTARVVITARATVEEQREEALSIAAGEWLNRQQIANLAAGSQLTPRQAAAVAGALSVLPPTQDPSAVVKRVLWDQSQAPQADEWKGLFARASALWARSDGFLRLGLVGGAAPAAAEALARHLGLPFQWMSLEKAATPVLQGQPARIINYPAQAVAPSLPRPGLYILVSPHAHRALTAAVDQLIELAPSSTGGLGDVLADAHGIGFEP